MIGMKLRDKRTGKASHVVNKTTNSVEAYLAAVGVEGINCNQWFTFEDFKKRFEVK